MVEDSSSWDTLEGGKWRQRGFVIFLLYLERALESQNMESLKLDI